MIRDASRYVSVQSSESSDRCLQTHYEDQKGMPLPLLLHCLIAPSLKLITAILSLVIINFSE